MTRQISIYAAAIQTLEDEYSMLARPSAAEMVAIVDRKEAIANKLRDAGLTPEQATKIRDLASRNQNRLAAVSKGTSSALTSLREFKSGASSALHYARDGRRTALHEVAGSLTRRA